MRAALVFCVLLATAAVVTGKHQPKQKDAECLWHDFLRHDKISAWEFQGQPHRHMIRNRDKAIRNIESILKQMTDDPTSGVQFVPSSRWIAIFKETSFMVSSRHGHPIHRDPEHPKEKPFPWKGLGYLRLRNYKLLTPAGAYVPSAMPGMADLTFKMKLVDPDVGPGVVQLPKTVGAAKLTAKVENDIHCDHGRPTMSPLYRPVSAGMNISRIANVKDYYPNLAEVAQLDENEVLPFMHEVYRAKIVWTVVFNGVIGEANLVIKYNTTFEDAVAGTSPKNGEISLRIRREVAEATGTTGPEGTQLLWTAMDTIGNAMQVFRDAGWDGKTPAVSTRKDYSNDEYNDFLDEDVDELFEGAFEDVLATTAHSDNTRKVEGEAAGDNTAPAAASVPRPMLKPAALSVADVALARASAVRQQANLAQSFAWLQQLWKGAADDAAAQPAEEATAATEPAYGGAYIGF